MKYAGRIWIRRGPRRGLASRDDERLLSERRRSGDLPFDRREAPLATLDDLDLSLFRDSYLPRAFAPDVLEANGRTLVEQLAALQLLSPSGRPTYGALLLLGRNPRRWLPGAYVQFVRVDGADLTDPILDQKELSGNMAEILRSIDDLTRINIRIATRVEGAITEERRPDYPHAALQQLLVNAVLHRSYESAAPVYWYWFDDRVEIHSPGGLYGRVERQNFGAPGVTDYRNPTLAEGLKILGFVQRFGMGIALARRRCADNDNPPPEFDFSPHSVLACVRRRP